MGDDEAALVRLWREKRGEFEPEDLSTNLIVQLGVVTEPLNRHWFERNTGQTLTAVQRRVQHPIVRWMAATLDGMVKTTGAVFEAKFMLPWSVLVGWSNIIQSSTKRYLRYCIMRRKLVNTLGIK